MTVAECTANHSSEWQHCDVADVAAGLRAPWWRWRILSTWGVDPGAAPKPREVQWNARPNAADGSSSGVVVFATGTAHVDGGTIYAAQNLMDGKADDASRWWPTGAYSDWSVVFDFRQGDSLLLLDTCGLSPEVLSSEVAINDTAMDAIATFSTYGRSLSIITSAGAYRLCWCSRGFDCSLPQAFAVDMGAITILGPTPLMQSRTCVAGPMDFP